MLCPSPMPRLPRYNQLSPGNLKPLHMLQAYSESSASRRCPMIPTMISQIRPRTWNRPLLLSLSPIVVRQFKLSYHPQRLYKDKSPMIGQDANFDNGSPSKCTHMRWRVRCIGEKYRAEASSRCEENVHDPLRVITDSQTMSRKNRSSIPIKALQAALPRSRYPSLHLCCHVQERISFIGLLLVPPDVLLLHSSVTLMQPSVGSLISHPHKQRRHRQAFLKTVICDAIFGPYLRTRRRIQVVRHYMEPRQLAVQLCCVYQPLLQTCRRRLRRLSCKKTLRCSRAQTPSLPRAAYKDPVENCVGQQG